MFITCTEDRGSSITYYDCLRMSYEDVQMTLCHILICNFDESIKYAEQKDILIMNKISNLINDKKYDEAIEIYDDHSYYEAFPFHQQYEIIDPTIHLIKGPIVPKTFKDQYLKQATFK